MSPTPPVVLSIAGSDSGGGAGIQADLATFSALGVHGTSALTAVTVQDTTGVHDIHPIPPDVVVAQIEAVLTDLAPAAVKVGMLGDVAVTRAVAALAAAGRLTNLVIDPVLVSTSGHALAATGVAAALREALLPHADLLTPNADEAAILLGFDPPQSVDDLVDQARALLALGPRAVVVTGWTSHSPKGIDRVDVLVTPTDLEILRSPEIETTNDHGTGCTFASAAAAFLARGATTHEAVRSARTFVRAALQTSAAWTLGAGRGPVAHTHTHQPTRGSR